MRRVFALLACVMLPTISAAEDVSVRMLFWNIEAHGSDTDEVERLVKQKKDVDVWGFCEVESRGELREIEEAIESERDDVDFESKLGSAGSNPAGPIRLAISYNKNRFRKIGDFQELSMVEVSNGNRPSLFVTLEGKATGQRFIFMVNHLSRGNLRNNTRQSKIINQWARQQDLPVVMMGDLNQDFPIDPNDTNPNHPTRPVPRPGFFDLQSGNQFFWLQPEELRKTQHDDRFNSILDFVMIHNAPIGWKGTSTILEVEGDEPADENDFDDDDESPDHRPVDAVFSFPGTPPPGTTPKAKMLERIQKLENELSELKALINQLD